MNEFERKEKMNEKKDKKKFELIDGETLMSKPLGRMDFVVESLIPKGLHILAGAPKTGKSWLVLWLCLQIAKGENIWDLKTTAGTTLYLCLEDSYARIQSRLFDITEDAPANVFFTTFAEGIGKGIEEQIENFVSEHGNTKLIVIDTLQKVRGVVNDNAYANDYHDLSLLKNLADKLNIAIILIHHLRKSKDGDPMNMVSGTTGITGAVDTTFVLVRNRNEQDAKLICDGRDIEYREMELTFHKETHIWELVSDSIENSDLLLDKNISLVCDYMKDNISFAGTASELSEKLQPLAEEKINPSVLSKRLFQNADKLEQMGILFFAKRSNGKRIIELEYCKNSAGSAAKNTTPPTHQFADPAGTADPLLAV